MKRCVLIPYKWVKVWGLSWTEAVVLADMLEYDCTYQERAERCNLSRRTILNAVSKILSNESAKIALLDGAKFAPQKVQNLHSKKCKNCTPKVQDLHPPKEKEKKEKKVPPITPLKNNKKNKEKEGFIIIKPAVSEIQDFAEPNAPLLKEKPKFSEEEIRFHGELKNIYLEEWKNFHDDDFVWSAAAMTSTIRISKQIRFLMPEEEKKDLEKIKDNFRIFIHMTMRDIPWYRDNGTPNVITSKFNEIYAQLKHGNNTNANATKGANKHQPQYSEEFLARVFADITSGNSDSR